MGHRHLQEVPDVRGRRRLNDGLAHGDLAWVHGRADVHDRIGTGDRALGVRGHEHVPHDRFGDPGRQPTDGLLVVHQRPHRQADSHQPFEQVPAGQSGGAGDRDHPPTPRNRSGRSTASGSPLRMRSKIVWATSSAESGSKPSPCCGPAPARSVWWNSVAVTNG